MLSPNIRVDMNCQPTWVTQNAILGEQELILLGGGHYDPPPPDKVGLMGVFLSHLIKQSGPKVSKEKGAKEYRGLSCLTLRKVHFVLLLKRGKTNCNNRYVLDILRRCSRFKG